MPGTRVPGEPTDESCTRFRFAGSITRIRNFILINYDAINKTQEDLPLETAKHFVRYALPTTLSRCNDHAVDTNYTSSSQPGTLSLVIGALGCLRQFDFDFEDEDPSASPSGLRLRNRVRLCQDWQLLCLSFYFRVPGYPTVTGIRYPVPKISVNARA